MKNNIDKQMLEKQKNRPKEKANTVFLKLYAKLNKPKNPFDEARSYTTPSMREIKPGSDYA
ncbi:MAG: hypothetical protein DAHOPDDO_02912 [Ignavibacteriaceae bacterium]|nr:hypothetical protein [Ignavibacteriaceae bacterium]